MTESGCLRISLEHYPGISPFVRDWLRREANATQFLRRATETETSARTRHAAPGLVAALDAANRRWGIFAKESLQRWSAGQSVTLVAGQQVGFAGGPLYTIAKIASLVKIKRDLEQAGRPATAFFWLATEDHDFEEVAQLSVPAASSTRSGVNRQLDLLSIKATRPYESKSTVGPIVIPEVLITELLALYDIQRPAWLRDGITFGDSFAELIASVFGSEVILIDSLLPELRAAGAPLFEKIRGEWGRVQASLRSRAAELITAGYTPQVTPRADGDYTLFFEIDDRGDRHIMERPRGVEPERTSTSALTRPLLQDFVLQPDLFLGGPAEVAYYAQIAPLHELLGVALPRVGLRGHALIAPKRVVRFVDRFGIAPSEMFTPPEQLIIGREPEAAAAIRRLAEDGNQQLARTIEKIGQIALPAEHSVARAVSRSIGHIEYHFNKLAERALRSVVRKDRERWTAARELAATLRPDDKVQDRVVGWLPFWLVHDHAFIDRLVSEIEPDSDVFKVISL